MCGILGWINPAITNSETASAQALPALRALHGRGPDGHSIECQTGWLLGHTRLAILDLTDRARQPMTDGRGAWLVYNGEAYNFTKLSEEVNAAGRLFSRGRRSRHGGFCVLP